MCWGRSLYPYRVGIPFVFSLSKAGRKLTQGFQFLSRKQSSLLAPTHKKTAKAVFHVLGRGLEPPLLTELVPKTSAATITPPQHLAHLSSQVFFLTEKSRDPGSRFLPLLRKTKISLRLGQAKNLKQLRFS